MRTDFLVQDAPLARLRRRWVMIASLYALVLWFGYQLLRTEWYPPFAWRWAIVAGCVLAYELGFLWRGLSNNHRPGQSVLLPTLGAGNILTMLRGLALGLLAGFVVAPRPSGWLAWAPALLYTSAITVDLLDGYAARVTNHTTELGGSLDIEFDALGILIATWLAVFYNQLPWWYLFLGLSRYLFLLGIWWRRRQGKSVHDLPPSTHRRIVAGFQMGFSSVMLWPLVYPPATTLAGVVFAITFTASFVRDWLVVSGRLDPASRTYREANHKVATVLAGWFPVVLRISVGVIAARSISPALLNEPQRIALFAWPGVPLPAVTGLAITLVAMVAAVLLILGVAGRLAALGLLLAASANILAKGLYLSNGFLLVGTIALLLLGSGALSWWRPEDVVLSQRAGERKES